MTGGTWVCWRQSVESPCDGDDGHGWWGCCTILRKKQYSGSISLSGAAVIRCVFEISCPIVFESLSFLHHHYLNLLLGSYFAIFEMIFRQILSCQVRKKWYRFPMDPAAQSHCAGVWPARSHQLDPQVLKPCYLRRATMHAFRAPCENSKADYDTCRVLRVDCWNLLLHTFTKQWHV